MKIISKYKDYYDYLQGIYGIDEKIILDRRDFDNITIDYFNKDKITFIVCGKCIDAYIINNKVHVGEELEMFRKKERFWYPKDCSIFYIDKKKFNKEIYDDKKKYNEIYNSVILIEHNKEFYKYPILSNFNFSNIMKPDIIYQMINNYLSKQISIKENITINLSDTDKLINKGFDKYSFKPKMK